MRPGIWMIIATPCLGMKRLSFDLNDLPAQEESSSPTRLPGVIFPGRPHQAVSSGLAQNAEPAGTLAEESIASFGSFGRAAVTALSSDRPITMHPGLTHSFKRQCFHRRIDSITENPPNRLSNSIDEPPDKDNEALASVDCSYPGLKFLRFPPSYYTYPDYQIIFEAIRSLKLPDGTLFFQRHDPEFQNIPKIPHLEPHTDFRHFYHVPMLTARQLEIISKAQIQHPDHQPIYKRKNHQPATHRATSTFQMANILMVKNYANLVMAEFSEKINSFLTKFREIKATPQDAIGGDYELRQFRKILRTLPLYFFYVDLINTIIGSGNMEDPTNLRSERKLAGTTFFDVVEKMLLSQEHHDLAGMHAGNEHHGSTVTQADNVISQAIKSCDGDRETLRSHFVWVIITDWLKIRGIAPADHSAKQKLRLRLNQYFKNFFNDIIRCFVEKFANSE